VRGYNQTSALPAATCRTHRQARQFRRWLRRAQHKRQGGMGSHRAARFTAAAGGVCGCGRQLGGALECVHVHHQHAARLHKPLRAVKRHAVPQLQLRRQRRGGGEGGNALSELPTVAWGAWPYRHQVLVRMGGGQRAADGRRDVAQVHAAG